MTLTEVSFISDLDGSKEHYVEMVPADWGKGARRDALIGLHGHGSDRWQYIREERGEGQGRRVFAACHGMLFISPDYRGTTSWMGPAAEADVLQIVRMIREQRQVRRVFLAGGSMGGTSVLILGMLHPELFAGISSLNGTANMLAFEGFQDAIAASYGGDKTTKADEYRRRSVELHPERLTMPLACTVSGRDTVVPPDSVRRLVRRLREMGKRDLLRIDRANVGHETSYQDTVSTLEFILDEADHRGLD